VTLYFILGLIALSLVVFSLSAGAFMYAAVMIRKDPAKSAKTKPSGRENKGISDLGEHTADLTIVVPMQQAAERWNKKRETGEVEKMYIINKQKQKLAGDLCLPSSISPPAFFAVLIHGYMGEASEMAYLGEEYLKQGAAVLLVNCRAHGESQGKCIGMGYPDARDLALWVAALRERFGGDIPILLHGISMGAAAALLYTALPGKIAHPDKVLTVVADCGFSSLHAQFVHQMKLVMGGSPIQWIVSRIILCGMSVINFCLNGFFFFQESPERALAKRRNLPSGNVPLILFHGEADKLVPAWMFDRLIQASGGKNLTIERVPNAPHLGSYFYEPRRYIQVIFSVLEGSASRKTAGDAKGGEKGAPAVSLSALMNILSPVQIVKGFSNFLLRFFDFFTVFIQIHTRSVA
jgi:pimeloyl-ACP methyl ester carboxylesterase